MPHTPDADFELQYAAHLYLPCGQSQPYRVTYADSDSDPDPRPHIFTNPHSISYGSAFCLLPYRHRPNQRK